MNVDPIRVQSVPFLLSEISISITHIHVLFVCRSLFLVERNPRLFFFFFFPWACYLGIFLGQAKLFSCSVLFCNFVYSFGNSHLWL